MQPRGAAFVVAILAVTWLFAVQSPAAAAASPSFGDGTYRVGSAPGQMPRGSYSAAGGARCAWTRYGPNGKTVGKGGAPTAQHVVLSATDTSFRTAGCGRWTQATSSATASPTTTATGTPGSTTTTWKMPVEAMPTVTTLPFVVRSYPCSTEGAMGINEFGIILICQRGICIQKDQPLIWLPKCGDPKAHIEPGQ